MRVRIAAGVLAVACALRAAVPAPENHFGHKIGADRTVLDWNKVVSYFKLLPKSSDRIRVEELGKTVEGRPFIAATIADPETLRNLPRYIDIQRRLADPRITSEADAEKLIAQGKAVVLITCSIHATELASTHSAVEFVYRLLTEDKPRFRAILNNTIFLLVPSLNPDGVDIVTRWYRRTLGTPYEGTSPPELYHKYVGHDNNRDWYMFTQPETRLTIAKLQNVWHPEIVYDIHQQEAFRSRIFVPPWLDPTEPNIDAILMQEMNMIGTAMASDLTAAGKKGVAIHASYDFWSPARHYQAFHGGLRILTESASARLASPIVVRREQLDRNALGYNTQERSWNFLEPWEGGEWCLRDIIDYQLIAMESCLYHAALDREDLLRNFYKVAQRQVARKSPYGFLIPADQRDPGATRKLIETLRFGMVEVEDREDGSHLIKMAQPYGGWAKALLEHQHYPDMRQYPGGPPVRPYDVTAHTLPLLMGVTVETLEGPPGESKKTNSAVPVLSASDTDSWRAINKQWNSGKDVWRNPRTGDFAFSGGREWEKIPRPRVGVYQSFIPSADEGWTRWLLQEFGFPYTSLYNKDIQAGNLRQRFDVIVFPDGPETRRENVEPGSVILNGYAPRSMPEEFTGGIGMTGVEALRGFTSAGGMLVFLNRASAFASGYLGVKAKNVTSGVSTRDFYAPGSLLNVRLDTAHPLAYGLPREIPIWFENSPAWETEERSVAVYPASGVLASGWLMGEGVLTGRSALVDARSGEGHVILFGMRPQYRGQSYLTFKLFFNSLLASTEARR